MSQTEIYAAKPEVVACDLEGGAALLDLRSSHYFSLNAVGSAIWEGLQTPQPLEALTALVSDRFEISAEACEGDVRDYLDRLNERGLISVTGR